MSDCERECYRIGGPWISADPDCPVHGAETQAREKLLDDIFVRWGGLFSELAKGPEDYGPHDIETLCTALEKALFRVKELEQRVSDLERAP
jgi:hypothetical protein